MTKEELIQKLKECAAIETEVSHITADQLLLEYINDPDISKAFDDLVKWYA